jgi:ABC-type dipeptide/oligopeptide/nickel transport system permease subunit
LIKYQGQAIKLGAMGWAGIIILGFFLFLALAAGILAPYGVGEQVDASFLTPSQQYLLGTDDLGYDILSLLIWGTRISLLIGISAALLGVGGGVIYGMIAGYGGGIIDRVLMRVSDIFQSLPSIPLFILIAAYAGSSIRNIILIIAIFAIPRTGRIIRGQVVSLKQNAYIQAAGMFGGSSLYLMKRHFIPELLPLVFTALIEMAGKAILMESGLAFLGIGDPGSKSWGMILHYALEYSSTYLTSAWIWWVMPPALCIALLCVSFALLGFALEDTADPRLREM